MSFALNRENLAGHVDFRGFVCVTQIREERLLAAFVNFATGILAAVVPSVQAQRERGNRVAAAFRAGVNQFRCELGNAIRRGVVVGPSEHSANGRIVDFFVLDATKQVDDEVDRDLVLVVLGNQFGTGPTICGVATAPGEKRLDRLRMQRGKRVVALAEPQHVEVAPVTAYLGKTWAPCGVTPIATVTGSRQSITALSAISSHGALIFQLLQKRVASAEFINFLRQMLEHHSQRHLVVVTDCFIYMRLQL